MDKLIKRAKGVRANAWDAFKEGLKIPGYKYYQPPPEVKYRFPAPGSCAMDEHDHPNLYKNDWKTPFRHSDYNTTKIEMKYDDEDPRQAENFISKLPSFDESNPNDKYWTDRQVQAEIKS